MYPRLGTLKQNLSSYNHNATAHGSFKLGSLKKGAHCGNIYRNITFIW